VVGDSVGEAALDLDDFLKNLDEDLLGGDGCWSDDEEPLEVAEEKKRERADETEGDCGRERQFAGNRVRKEE